MSTRPENISELRIKSGNQTSKINIFTPMVMGNLFYPYISDAADNTFVSLTIDILNKNIFKEKKFYNEKLIDASRNRQYFPSADDKWGFVETSNLNNTARNISNAFCFCGQKLQFYIAVKDQDCGYFNSQFVYCKTKLTVSIVNVSDGSSTILKEFSNFELDTKDSERYFTWEVPSCSTSVFNDYGIFGLYVIRLDIERTFFDSAELTTLVSDNLYVYRNQGLLQLLTYSAPKEALEVDSLVSWLNNKSFSETTTIEEVFDHTLVYDLEDSNMPLTDDQKRAIVADQVAFLFIAQHPTITADYYPSCIVGLGVNENIRSETIIKKLTTYSRRYPEVIELAKNRLFNILCTYQKYNFIKDIESCFNDYTQSLQVLRDPIKTLFIDRSGNLKAEYGSNGILLNPYALNTTEASLPSDVIFHTTDYMTFRKCDVDIDNVKVTQIDGSPLGPDTRYALVSFNITSGENDIARIRYTLWTANNLNMFEYIDDEGTSRWHVFDCEHFGDIIYSATTGDIVFVRIDIEDKNRFVKSFYGAQFVYAIGENFGPGFTTIETSQRQDGGGMVDIYYDYVGTSEINNSIIGVSYSTNNGSSWISVDNGTLRGDFGIAVMPGRNHIVWEPVKPGESSSFGNYVLVKLTLYDINKQNNKGIDSNISVLRFDKPIVAIRKLTDDEEKEMWMSSSSTSSSSTSNSSSSSSSSTSESSSSSSSTSNSSSSSSSSTSGSSSSSSSSEFLDFWVTRASMQNWGGIAMSSDGQKQSAVANNGYIYVSNDYGANWTTRDSIRDWGDIDVSADGQYQTASVYMGYLYVSSDYGASWTAKMIDMTREWETIAMSDNGQYQTVSAIDYIYTSNDYGANWTARDSIRDWYCVDMSGSGQYQTAGDYYGYIYTSNDYGVTWTPRDSVRNWQSVAVSNNGQIQTAVVYGGYIYISNDYGVTWTAKMTDTARAWMDIAMSENGETQTTMLNGGGTNYIYSSTDYGNTWHIEAPYLTQIWISVAMSSDGMTQALTSGGGFIYENYRG
jgi:hypothetical protein